MQRQYVVLREELRDQRTTIADAIDVLVTEAKFNSRDSASIWLQRMQLPSHAVVWLVSVVFDGSATATSFVVPLRTATAFFAIQHGKSRKKRLEIELLNGATVDAHGVVSLPNGDRVRAVELIPAQLPYELSELDQTIIHLTVSIMKAESRCYRDLRDDIPDAERDGIPSLRFLDFSKLAEAPGRPPLNVPLLKQIRGKFEKTYPRAISPSEQKIADALEKAGIRVPRRRPKAA